ncbi:MAG: hypothetical protein QXJ11_01250 [Candidatus Bathyarchaeia archaeon]
MKFVCPYCGLSFHVSRLKLLFARRFSGYTPPHPNMPYPHPDPTPVPKTAYYLKCPNCQKKSWMTPVNHR